MFGSAYLLLEFFNQVGQVQGRKKLQKMIYLLKTSGSNFPFKYEYHFYGPYSAQLQSEINYLAYNGFLEEKKENDTYVYAITEQGQKFRDKLIDCLNYTAEINGQLTELLATQNSQFLEMVSTYAFLIESGYKKDEARAKCVELKPHLQKYIDSAMDFYHTNF